MRLHCCINHGLTMTNITLPVPTDSQTDSESPTPAPAEISWALKLLWLGLAFNVVQYLFSLPAAFSVMPADSTARAAAMFGVAVPIAGFILGAWLNVKIARKRNWARIVKLVIEAASLVLLITMSPQLAVFDWINVGIAPALHFIALYLLFISSGRLWFRRTSAHTGV
jgi:hypothetical protein